MAVEKLSLKIHIFFALLGLFAGVLGFMVFVFGFYNLKIGYIFYYYILALLKWDKS